MHRDPGPVSDPPDPPDLVEVRIGNGTWMVRLPDAGALEASGAARLLEGPGRPAGGPGRGRAEILRLRVGSREAVGKRALHGGLLGGLLGGIYLGSGRLDQVARVTRRLRATGVPTPEIIATGWRAVAGPLRALALITEAIPGGVSLQERLLESDGGSGAASRRRLLHASGGVVRAMHDTGFRHADLNLANLVVEPAIGGPRIHIVDLDRGRFVTGGRGRWSDANLGRLFRSWEKWIEPRRAGGYRDLVAFLRGYSSSPVERRRLAEWLLREQSGMRVRRIVWRWRGHGGPALSP